MRHLITAAIAGSFFLTVPVSAQVLYNNGTAQGGSGAFGITTDSGAGFGGTDASQAAAAYGRSVSAPIFSDDFTLNSFQSVISSLTVYSHISNNPSTVSPFIATTIDIYSGRPGSVGSSIIASSSSQISSVFSNVYRVPSGTTAATLTDATRPVFATTVAFTNLTLDAGTYWFSFRQTSIIIGNINVSGVTNVSNGTVQIVSGNALGFNATSGTWDPLYHLANPVGSDPNAPAIQMELPFLVNGRAIEAPPPPAAPEPGSLLLAILPVMGALAARHHGRARAKI